MQINSIILFKDETNIRTVEFTIGKVNIITGESKSGKSAITDIVDYCLGSRTCHIAEGVIRETVRWFSVMVTFRNGEVYFLARRNPNIENASTTSVCVLPSSPEKIPEFNTLKDNMSINELRMFLTSKLGISENIQKPMRNTRDALEANVRHALAYCFQPQTLIAQRDFLFFKQQEQFIPQAIKDTFPYFIGAIREDALQIEQEIYRLKKELNRLERIQEESNRIRNQGMGMAISLIDEAKQIGIINISESASNEDEAIKILNKIKNSVNKKEKLNIQSDSSMLTELLNQRESKRLELGKLDATIDATKDFIGNSSAYASEMSEQKFRLESIKFFEDDSIQTDTCPLCGNGLHTNIPAISSIKNSLKDISESLDGIQKENPRLNRYLDSLKNKKIEIENEILGIENSISSLYKEQERASKLKDLNIRIGTVLGRITLFLESLDKSKNDDLSENISSLQSSIETLSKKIDNDSKNNAINEILNKINLQMSTWIKSLDSEYNQDPIRFDLTKLTLVADTSKKSIPLNNMGSGENWVVYHLLIFLALHKHFIQESRPVPDFLILDQPTQVYYPPDKIDAEAIASTDEIAVEKMFNFIISVVKELAPNLQVIITDHAHLNNKDFNDCICETWRGGTKLIPISWIP